MHGRVISNVIQTWHVYALANTGSWRLDVDVICASWKEM